MTDAGYWAPHGLRLTEGDLELRPVTEADLLPLADLLPPELELDPAATLYAGLTDQQVSRGVVIHQEYWRALGTWSIIAWRLGFAVRLDGELVGFQELEGNDFPVLRTVDTSSWLVSDVRGQGVGKWMRTAVLALAFGPLEARLAITSAWHDNHASLGVSRALGYEPNGEALQAREGFADLADRMIHMRLTRDRWLASGQGADVVIEGVESCRPFFGM